MSSKRVAHSPLEDDKDEKRLREDSFCEESDSDATILTPGFLSSTVLESEELSDRHPAAIDNLPAIMSNSDLKKELQSVLCEPEIIEMISKVVAAQFSEALKKEIVVLKEQLIAKDKEITTLREKVDELEQYGRRNCIRISGVPESPNEDTDAIVKNISEALDVEISDEMIDRSHRVGARSPAGGGSRPILVKFVSYRHKRRLMSEKKKLSQADPKKMLPGLRWLSASSQSASQSVAANRRLYLNDDLTRTRAEIAAIARNKKKNKVIENTWVRDGVIFVQAQGTIHRITTKRGLDIF